MATKISNKILNFYKKCYKRIKSKKEGNPETQKENSCQCSPVQINMLKYPETSLRKKQKESVSAITEVIPDEHPMSLLQKGN